MQVSLNTQNTSCNYLTPTFKGIIARNEVLKKILTERDIANLQYASTRRVSRMCMQTLVNLAEKQFFNKYPECNIEGMNKLCRNAIRGKALKLLKKNKRKEIDFEVKPEYNTDKAYFINFYSCDFPIPFKLGFVGSELGDKEKNVWVQLYRGQNYKSLEEKLHQYASDENYYFPTNTSKCEISYEELVNNNNEIKSLLASPLYEKAKQLEQLKNEIAESTKNTKQLPVLMRFRPYKPESHKGLGQ